ncbi:MAG TPA: hypothetical protein VMH86_12305 [Rhizomicrobium sp.]|nr:hypothetical protein [Rhizomicrobium sp.]
MRRLSSYLLAAAGSVALFAAAAHSQSKLPNVCGPGSRGCPHAAARIVPPQVSHPVTPQAASCKLPGGWTESFGGIISISKDLTGTMKLPYCSAIHNLALAQSGNGFTVNATYTGGSECQGFTESLTFQDCSTASGSYVNDDGTSGSDTWTSNGGNLMISQPQADEKDNLDPDARTVSVTYEGTSSQTTDTVAWTVDISYTTSGGVGPFTKDDSFNTGINQPRARNYAAVGGQVTVNATGQASGAAPQVQSYITGSNLSRKSVTAYLNGLYGTAATGAGLKNYTADLMSGVAFQESSCQHFHRITLYNTSAFWPAENYTTGNASQRGLYIGLTQVPTTMKTAWDWNANGTQGVSIMGQKLTAAVAYQKSMQATHTGLKGMTGVELEDVALLMYAGYANVKGTGPQYFQPSCSGTPNGATCTGGTWTWVQRPNLSSGALGYVATVRGHTSCS